MRETVLLLLAFCQICRAELVRFEEANFSIDIPATWTKAEAPPEALAVFRSPDDSKGVTLMTAKFSPEDAPTALEKMISGAKRWAKNANSPISGEHEKVIDGVTFRGYSATLPGDVTVNAAMAVVGVRGYSIQGFSGGTDAATDAEILGILDSFRLLTKASSPAAGRSSEGAAYKFGELVGKWAMIALIAGAVILSFLKSLKRSKEPA